MLPIKKILCPTDFSEPSLAALDAACELGHSFDAEVLLLHVLSLAPPFPTDMIVIAGDGLYPTDQERTEEATRQLKNLIAHRVSSGVRAATEVKMGYAPEEIVSAADADSVDIIVMGTHGTTGWRHLAFGSVTEKVVRTAHRPVLTVHSGQLGRREEPAQASSAAAAH
jgi:nucleotide-binding universal stress UspA family protein